MPGEVQKHELQPLPTVRVQLGQHTRVQQQTDRQTAEGLDQVTG